MGTVRTRQAEDNAIPRRETPTIEIPLAFRQRYEGLAPAGAELVAALLRPQKKAFRVNTIKATIADTIDRLSKSGIAVTSSVLTEEAFETDSSDLGLSLEAFLGNIYIQELSSMLPPLAVREELLGAQSVLDACAAPGSKTTQLAALMRNRGHIVANDIDYNRLRALKFNLARCGVWNTSVTNSDLHFLREGIFDVVLLDAPCSAEGNIQRNNALLRRWHAGQGAAHAVMQKRLITRAFDLLAPGGVMIYSTCAFAPEENEEVVDHLLTRRPARLEVIPALGLELSPGFPSYGEAVYDSSLGLTRRAWPHLHGMTGFYLARIRK